MRFFCPQGIGDSLWALHKIRAIAQARDPGKTISLTLASSGVNDVQRRSLPFLSRFPFLESVCLLQHDCVVSGEPRFTSEGYWNYIPDGWMDDIQAFALMPNATLERGKRLEEWLPSYAIDWGTMDEFRFTPEEETLGEKFASGGKYAVFYPGPTDGNTLSGHNRGPLWTPQQWIDLGRQIQALGLRVVVVGATYDDDYFRQYLLPGVSSWENHIGEWEIGQTLAVVKRASLVVSFQSGIGICAHYFGVPTVMWWRPKGDSTSPRFMVSFEEDMAHSWTNPIYRDRYLPLIYGRCSVEEIASFARSFA